MKKIVFVFLSLCILQGCSKNAPELKSPCVGIKGSPCGERVPVNDPHWLKTLS